MLVSLYVFLLIISYRHVIIQLAENLCEEMAPSTLGPVVILQDKLALKYEICSIRLPIDMSLGDTTIPTTWSGTGDHGLGKPHSCIVLSVEESSKDESRYELEVLVLRTFGVGGRAKVKNSPHNHLLLPLPCAGTPLSTPVGFGAPLVSPRFQSLKETWLVARVVRIEVLAQSKVSQTSLGYIKPLAKVS